MKKYVYVSMILAAILAVSIALTANYAGQSENEGEHRENLVVVTSFYPMYIAAMNIVGDTEGITLKNLSEPQTGCLHDFQLTPEDMKLLSTADVFIINGGGIESFMKEVAAAYEELVIIEACENVKLLSDEEEENAHAWMSVSAYRTMVDSIAQRLGEADAAHAEEYAANAKAYDEKLALLEEKQEEVKAAAEGERVVLFHEAYDYIAEDYGLSVSYVMDLDEERQISAGEVADLLHTISKDEVHLVLAEELYGKDMGDTVEKETDAKVLYLDPLNRGDYEADSYLNGMEKNIELLSEYFID